MCELLMQRLFKPATKPAAVLLALRQFQEIRLASGVHWIDLFVHIIVRGS